MASLADHPELIGFFSYSREDDEGSAGALTALRDRIQHELRAQLGRSFKNFRLWQDKEAIPAGTLWEEEIKAAVAQSSFFIPIITPTVVKSPHCQFELNSFLAREAELGRSDLVFPILYIGVPALNDAEQRKTDPVLSLITRRQYVDWRVLRHHDVNSMEVKEALERFCMQVSQALQRRWLTPEERRALEETAGLQAAEAERKRREDEAKRREEEVRQKAEETQARERAEQEQRQREAEAEKYRADGQRRQAEEQRLRDEAAAKDRAEKEQRRGEAHPFWPPSRPVLAGGALFSVAVIAAIAVWVGRSPSTPVAPPDSGTQTYSPVTSPPNTGTHSSTLISQCKNDPKEVSPDVMIDSCNALVQSGRWSGADTAWLYNNIGKGYFLKEDYNSALSNYDHALQVDPNDAYAYCGRGITKNKIQEGTGDGDIAYARQLNSSLCND